MEPWWRRGGVGLSTRSGYEKTGVTAFLFYLLLIIAWSSHLPIACSVMSSVQPFVVGVTWMC